MFAPQRRGMGAHRWAGHVLVTLFSLTETQAGEIIAKWLRTGLLVETEFRDADQRKTRIGVRVNDSLRPTITPHPGPLP